MCKSELNDDARFSFRPAQLVPVEICRSSEQDDVFLPVLANRYPASKAECDNPPSGRFLEINGLRLHYVERGAGDPVVLLQWGPASTPGGLASFGNGRFWH